MFTTEIFGAYFEQALKEQLADNVQYVETRAPLGPVSLVNIITILPILFSSLQLIIFAFTQFYTGLYIYELFLLL